jgi:hypothetical protein
MYTPELLKLAKIYDIKDKTKALHERTDVYLQDDLLCSQHARVKYCWEFIVTVLVVKLAS